MKFFYYKKQQENNGNDKNSNKVRTYPSIYEYEIHLSEREDHL